MKIGVVSDTHSLKLPKQMLDDFKNVDLIIHAGDFCSLEVIEKFKKIKKVLGVWGNMDGSDVREIFPRKTIIKQGKFAIGLFHGEGPPQTLLKIVEAEFKDAKVDVIIFGHSHQPMNESRGGVLYFNPGSPNDLVFAPYQSYGILEINDAITGTIIKVNQ